ncbi:MAG: HAD family phosphatase [Candidatus Sulfotelmatobacter sp.]
MRSIESEQASTLVDIFSLCLSRMSTVKNGVAIIFDMDGVLIDSEPAHKLAKERAFARFGITLPEQVYEQYKGRPDETMVKEVVSSIPGTNINVQALLRYKHLEFESLEHLAKPVPGAKEFVTWAQSKFRIALATSATPRNREAALVLLGLGDSFNFVVDACGFSRPKPDPEVFHKAMRGLGADPTECFVIEDSLNGVLAGKAAGCHVVGITTSFSETLLLGKGADHVVHTFPELRRLMEWTLKADSSDH